VCRAEEETSTAAVEHRARVSTSGDRDNRMAGCMGLKRPYTDCYGIDNRYAKALRFGHKLTHNFVLIASQILIRVEKGNSVGMDIFYFRQTEDINLVLWELSYLKTNANCHTTTQARVEVIVMLENN
jgi:hypothetical protein